MQPDYELNFGPEVACDFCNCNGEECTGGVIMGSYAICGCCCEAKGYYDPAYQYANEIDEYLDREKTFAKNVLAWREKQYGSQDGIMQFWSFD